MCADTIAKIVQLNGQNSLSLIFSFVLHNREVCKSINPKEQGHSPKESLPYSSYWHDIQDFGKLRLLFTLLFYSLLFTLFKLRLLLFTSSLFTFFLLRHRELPESLSYHSTRGGWQDCSSHILNIFLFDKWHWVENLLIQYSDALDSNFLMKVNGHLML